jgi:hypothetical protein
MFGVTKQAIASVLALAIIVLPIVLDRCAESCEAQHRTIASTANCHHASSSAAQMGHETAPCGHDHHGIAVASSNDPAPARPLFNAMIAVATASTSVSPTAAAYRIPPHAPPGSSLDLHRRSLPLRI